MTACTSTEPLLLEVFQGQHVLLPQRTAAVPSLPEAVESAFAKHAVVPSAYRTSETIQTGLPLIEAGLARGIRPDPDRLSLQRFHLAVRPLDPSPEPLRALLLARRSGRENRMIGRFLDYLQVERA